ncbi:uncharacterized protein LAJ45_04260 [Morchella importuna]|uniref:uncharacterized protein n=1 Tax=Morchella importuna TaxID=1174673 RepID=UPI001E8ED057|nr:uncharacterized protein LAJ45_04260 [Morchella importuna]KAH8151638.1 hypothetical protein LAJ45_04260 [Morchella importuna]
MRHYYFFSILLLSIPTASGSQPPHQATALLTPDLSTLYLFIPPSPSSQSFRFLSLPLNNTYSTSNFTHSFIELSSPPLPPSSSSDANAISIAPILFPTGQLAVLTGSCDTDITIHEYSSHSNTWNPRSIAPPSGRGERRPLRYHARAFAYGGEAGMREFEQGVVITTSTVNTAYVFGGVCPAAGGGVEYSTGMMEAGWPLARAQSYVPGERKGKGKGKGSSPPSAPAVQDGEAVAAAGTDTVMLAEYDGRSNREWPIAEAGFSLTTISTREGGGGGAGSVVMVGGYTAGAFVDMRQVAVYSAPDGRWRFADVGLPAASPPRLRSSETRVLATGSGPVGVGETTKTDPSARVAAVVQRRNDDTRRIDPRSGHSAVATRDGKRIVVYGGWVGDFNTPAEPRLVILEMTGEAGRDEWRWDIPFIHPGELGPPTDGEAEGLSGHAAVMLEGDVMMITSGYRISPFVNASVVNTKSYFFNVTSGMWAGTYKPAGILAAEEEEAAGRKSEHRRTTGIVLGVIFGVAGLAAAIIGYHWYFRKGRRTERDAEGAGPLERERWGSFGFYGGPSASEERLGSFNCYGTEKPSMMAGSTERLGLGSIYGSRRLSMSQERLGIYGSHRASLSQERVGIVETRSHSYRVLGEEAAVSEPRPASPPASASRPPLLRKTSYLTTTSTAAVPGIRPPPKALLKTNPARVSTIFEAEENAFDPNRGSRGSSCAATTGSDDDHHLANLQNLYTRSLAFAEKMAAQEIIYEQQSRSRSRSTTLSGEWSDQTASLPRIPPRAALSSESLSLVPTAPVRIPYNRSFPPSVTRVEPVVPRPRVKTLLTPARFFPEQVAKRRVVSLAAKAAGELEQEKEKQPPRRWASISALRSALPDILPTSPISLWETPGSSSRFSRNASSSASAGTMGTIGSAGDVVEMPSNMVLDSALGVGMGMGMGFSGLGDEWDLELEAAIEKRVVQVLFTAPKGALRVVNLDERVVAPSVDEEEVEEKVKEVVEVKMEVEVEKVVDAPTGKVELKVVIPAVEEKVFESSSAPGDVIEVVPGNVGEGILEMICQ